MVGFGATTIGSHPDSSPTDLALEALDEALASSSLSPAELDGLYLVPEGYSRVQPPIRGQRVVERLGLEGRALVEVENGGCSAMLAFKAACQDVATGHVAVAAVLGGQAEIREITVGVLDRLHGRDTCDLVTDVAQPVVSRVIGSFMGIAPEDDEPWATIMNSLVGFGDPDLNPNGPETIMEREIPLVFERCRVLIAERREKPTEDLTSVLVHAEIDGEKTRRARDRDGLLSAHGGRQRLDQGDLLQRDARAHGTLRSAQVAARRSRVDPGRRRRGAANVSGVRALSAYRYEGHRAQRSPDPRGRQGRPLVPVLEPGRDAL